jgi:hypothetical protein
MAERPARRVLLIGWEAADWDLVTPLLEAGQMPGLEGLIERGVMGDLASPAPLVPAALWTSLVTGRRADGHGVLCAEEPDPEAGGFRPIPSTARRTKALWNILTQQGLRTHVIGWPASHPVEAVNGVGISDRYARAAAPRDEPWPLEPGTVHPDRLGAALAGLRLHPGELLGAHLLPFVPEAARIDQERDPRLADLAEALAETISVHAAATWLLEHEPCDFLAVRYGRSGASAVGSWRTTRPGCGTSARTTFSTIGAWSPASTAFTT